MEHGSAGSTSIPPNATKPAMLTEQETSQPNRTALEKDEGIEACSSHRVSLRLC